MRKVAEININEYRSFFQLRSIQARNGVSGSQFYHLKNTSRVISTFKKLGSRLRELETQEKLLPTDERGLLVATKTVSSREILECSLENFSRSVQTPHLYFQRSFSISREVREYARAGNLKSVSKATHGPRFQKRAFGLNVSRRQRALGCLFLPDRSSEECLNELVSIGRKVSLTRGCLVSPLMPTLAPVERVAIEVPSFDSLRKLRRLISAIKRNRSTRRWEFHGSSLGVFKYRMKLLGRVVFELNAFASAKPGHNDFTIMTTDCFAEGQMQNETNTWSALKANAQNRRKGCRCANRHFQRRRHRRNQEKGLSSARGNRAFRHECRQSFDCQRHNDASVPFGPEVHMELARTARL